jgi:GxxExxY protein
MNDDKDKLTEASIGCAVTVSNIFEAGFHEKVYENALVIELKTSGLRYEQQKPVPVTYRGIMVGDYYAEIFVQEQVILEI